MTIKEPAARDVALSRDSEGQLPLADTSNTSTTLSTTTFLSNNLPEDNNNDEQQSERLEDIQRALNNNSWQHTNKLPGLCVKQKDNIKVIYQTWTWNHFLEFFCYLTFQVFPWFIPVTILASRGISITRGRAYVLVLVWLFIGLGIFNFIVLVQRIWEFVYITLDGTHIRVVVWPFCFLCKKIIPVDQIHEIDCDTRVHQHRSRQRGNYTTTTYEVHGIGNDGSRTILVQDLKTLDEAEVIKQEIENYESRV